MKARLFTSLIFSALLGMAPAVSAELKPYQKEALKKLEELHGGMWPMVKPQIEGVIAGSSEEQTKAIVKMVSEARGNAAAKPQGGPVAQRESS